MTAYTNRSVTYTILFETGGPEDVPILTFALGGFAASLADIDSAVAAFVTDLNANEPISNVTRQLGATGTDGDPWMTP